VRRGRKLQQGRRPVSAQTAALHVEAHHAQALKPIARARRVFKVVHPPNLNVVCCCCCCCGFFVIVIIMTIIITINNTCRGIVVIIVIIVIIIAIIALAFPFRFFVWIIVAVALFTEIIYFLVDVISITGHYYHHYYYYYYLQLI
jgi:hypothetical protein